MESKTTIIAHDYVLCLASSRVKVESLKKDNELFRADKEQAEKRLRDNEAHIAHLQVGSCGAVRYDAVRHTCDACQDFW